MSPLYLKLACPMILLVINACCIYFSMIKHMKFSFMEFILCINLYELIFVGLHDVLAR